MHLFRKTEHRHAHLGSNILPQQSSAIEDSFTLLIYLGWMHASLANLTPTSTEAKLASRLLITAVHLQATVGCSAAALPTVSPARLPRAQVPGPARHGPEAPGVSRRQEGRPQPAKHPP